MSRVKDFYQQLPDADRDLFAAMANGMVNSAPPEKLERLRTFHSQLKLEIDEINKKRQALGVDLNNVETMIKDLDKFVAKEGDGLDLQLFRAHLIETAEQIKAEVATMKPEEKLVKKHDLSKRLAMLEQRRALAQNLLKEVINGAARSCGSEGGSSGQHQ